MDEAFLLRAAVTGDLNAYNRLVLSYQDEIYTLIYYLHLDERSVSEAVQRIFLLAFQKLDAVDGKDFRSLLLQCTVQTFREQWKRHRQSLREKFTQSKGEGEKTGKQSLRYSLACLPLDLKLALALVDMAGLEYPQAARALGISVQTLSQQLAMARVRISRQID